ncbi:SA1320 family protein [Listeria aquatica]|uniref:SA1320 family protein n=1 Tax=Listeria aquatica TaxID=1494960 RepID=UPI003EF6F8E2
MSIDTKRRTSDLDIIEMSGKWVYTDPPEKRKLDINGTVYKVKEGKYNTKSGLDYMVVENTKTHEVGMIFQGTQGQKNGGKDIVTDATLPGNIPDEQLKAADKAYKKMSKRYKISYVGGNSLGGGLGNYVASNNDVPSVTYNPAILPDCEYSNKNPDITNYMSEYDPLTLGERSAGYTERLPGKNVILKNNIPLFATIASNHTGYDDPIKIDGEEVLIDADAYLPVGVWSGAILTGGKGHKIDVNPENMKILANSMVSRMKGQITTAQSHVDHAVDIVEREGNKLDDRTTKLKDGFDDLIGQGVFGKALTTMSGYEFLRDIIESGNPAISKATEAVNRIKNSSAFSDFLLSFLGNFNGMVGVGIKLPILIIDTVTRLDDIVTQVNALKKGAIPMLFQGIDNEFFNDGMVAELKAHYKIIDENKDVVTNQIITFGSQVKYVSDELEKADKLLTATEKIERASAPPATSDFSLKESKALKDGMGKKQKLLDNNFKRFREATLSSLDPVIDNFSSTLNLLDETVDDFIQGLKNARGTFEHIDIPFTNLDTAIPILITEAINSLKPYQTALESVKTAVRSLRGGGLNDVLEAYRPYIDTALFEGTQFQNVIVLNKASVNIYESSKAVFKDIQYQLSDNKAVAVEALDKQADKVVKNLAALIGQLKRGSIDV